MKPAPPVTRILMMCLRVSTRSQALGAPASDHRVCGKLQTLATLQAIERAIRLSTLPGASRRLLAGPAKRRGGPAWLSAAFIKYTTTSFIVPRKASLVPFEVTGWKSQSALKTFKMPDQNPPIAHLEPHPA